MLKLTLKLTAHAPAPAPAHASAFFLPLLPPVVPALSGLVLYFCFSIVPSPIAAEPTRLAFLLFSGLACWPNDLTDWARE